VKELFNCQNATVSHHSFDSIASDREMQRSGSSVGAISCLSVEKSQVTGLANHSTSTIKKVSANLCTKSILNTISPFFLQCHLWLRDARDWQQRQGDIRSVGGDMMTLVACSPKNGKGDVNVNSPPLSLMLTLTMHITMHLLCYYLDVCVVFIKEKTNGRVCP
jgi:hypothetical protein